MEQKEFASKGVAGTGLGLGIAGTALGLLQQNGGLAGILGGGNSAGMSALAAAVPGVVSALANGQSSKCSELESKVAQLEAEKASGTSRRELHSRPAQSILRDCRHSERLGRNQEDAVFFFQTVSKKNSHSLEWLFFFASARTISFSASESSAKSAKFSPSKRNSSSRTFNVKFLILYSFLE